MFDYEDALPIVEEYIRENNPTAVYTVREGHKCVWVSMGRTEQYYIVKDGKVVDIIID